ANPGIGLPSKPQKLLGMKVTFVAISGVDDGAIKPENLHRNIYGFVIAAYDMHSCSKDGGINRGWMLRLYSPGMREGIMLEFIHSTDVSGDGSWKAWAFTDFMPIQSIQFFK
ncbi:hypothetical protein KKC06_02995, partial [Patescibacteria group bacterium]|nr:hypothetical protein [Patescibacteria group bacterium]